MATITGTNGNDTLVGTSKNDTISPLRGYDTIDGAGGIDTLNVNYSALPPLYPWAAAATHIYSTGGIFWGDVKANNGLQDQVNFKNIEKLNIVLDAGNNDVTLDGAALAKGATISINAGGGTDSLSGNYTAIATVSFVVGANGTVTSNVGTYSGFESYWIATGAGKDTVTTGNGNDYINGGAGNDTLTGGGGNDDIFGGTGSNTLKGGAGDDRIYSSGVDKVDGGAGVDRWIGSGPSASAVTFTFNGATGSGSMSNGTTLAGIEAFEVSTGSANDKFTLSNLAYASSVNGGAGVDTLTVTAGNGIFASYCEIGVDGAGSFRGTLGGGALYALTTFVGIEKLSYAADNGNNYISVNAFPLLSGATLSLNGNGGKDTLALDLSGFSNTKFNVGSTGALTTNLPATFSNFETYSLILGNGNNTVGLGAGDDSVLTRVGSTNAVTTAAGNDQVTSAGVDKVDLGLGEDRWYGDYATTNTGLSFSYSNGQGSLSNGSTVKGAETIELHTGAGNDSFVIGYGGQLVFDAGEGEDSAKIDYSAAPGFTSAQIGSSNGSWLGDFYGDYVHASISSAEHLEFIGSNADDGVTVDGAALAAGATLKLDGGGGSDFLSLQLTALGDTVFQVGNGGLVNSNAGSYSNFETFELFLGDGNNRVRTAAGDDVIHWGTGAGTYEGGGGNDTFYGRGADTVDGGDGDDRWLGDYAAVVNDLTFTFDQSSGTMSNGLSLAGIEAISLITGSGNDTVLIATTNQITFSGGDGVDSLTLDRSGASLDDFVYIAAGEVVSGRGSGLSFDSVETLDFIGDDGNTYVSLGYDPGSQGAVAIDGGLGDDKINAQLSVADGVILTTDANGTISTNTGLTLKGFETVTLQLSDSADTASFGNGDDFIFGRGGDDSIAAGGGADQLSGGEGNDSLAGGAGDDRLDGGLGIDSLTGGAGADTFIFYGYEANDLSTPDTIADFSSADGDKIALQIASNGPFSFVGTDDFSANGSAQIHYIDQGGGNLRVEADSDGDGIADYSLIVVASSLSASDFFV